MSCDCDIRFGPQPPSEEEMKREAVEWGKWFAALIEKSTNQSTVVGISLGHVKTPIYSPSIQEIQK